jgi:hypothetical protein
MAVFLLSSAAVWFIYKTALAVRRRMFGPQTVNELTRMWKGGSVA